MARLTIQFPDNASEVVKELSKEQQVSQTDVIRRALALYEFLYRETRDGKKVTIADESNKIVKEVVFEK